MESEPPKYLYRYMKVDEYLEKLIVSHEIGFASPSTFNDPFDCKIHLSWDKFKTTERSYIEKILNLADPPFSQDEKNFHLDKMLRSEGEFEKYMHRAQSLFRGGVNDFSVLCLSEEPNNILLWSHYATKHQGVCVRFLNPGKLFNEVLLKVDYSQDVSLIDFLAPKETYVAAYIKALRTKAEQWAYEHEWRVIVPTGAMGLSLLNGYYSHPFPENPIDRVILGSQTDQKDRQKISAWIGQQNIELVQAEEVEGKFQLRIPD